MISKTIQNEVTVCVAEIVRYSIVDSVKKARFFLFYGTKLQTPIQKNKLHFEAIDQELEKLELNYEFLNEQGYDAGSKMAGKFNCVQAFIVAQQPIDMYTCCWQYLCVFICICKRQMPTKRLLYKMVTISKFHSETSTKACMYGSAIRREDSIVALETAYCLSLTLKLREKLQTPKQHLSTALSMTTDELEVFENTRREAETEFGSIFKMQASVKYEYFLDGSSFRLKSKFKLRRKKWDSKTKNETAREALKYCDMNTSTAERSFLSLRRLKTYLKSTMRQVRLNGLALANIHREWDINVESGIYILCIMNQKIMIMSNWSEDSDSRK
ncbi:hypothetical protein PR048_009283 [Dryococelus australis]|uniref:HAT C-terminal dimerisation domain-containing protein n=1 Tax=Dryococelus australis TaxID=614101 RepID=A0ABQ9I0J5_9NEOP|nr:hypothetical protein PR048_009283 [Dryococelus australis]